MNFNTNWKFNREDVTSGHLLYLDEKEFQTVDLPHDYSIEQPYNHEEGEGNTGYLLGGMGWYRKHFTLGEEIREQRVFVCFDGIYNRSNIYVNEQFLAFHPYGYSPLLLDITDYIKEGENVLAVQVDHTRYADSRWYTGSGIYRPVELHILPKTYIPVWGIQIQTNDVTIESANVQVSLELDGDLTIKTKLQVAILDPQGNVVVDRNQEVTCCQKHKITEEFKVENPCLWDIYKGNQYQVVVKLIQDEKVIQEKITKFGIRSFNFDTNTGFYLNGKSVLIKGVCLHHDGGAVGAAVPKDVWKRRLQTLIEGGCNAIRTAHNPASAEFLDLCDEMGLLVQEEFYDEWDNPKDKRFNMKEQKVDYITRGHHEFFKDYAEQDLKAVILRDINHPCIFQWSIGNEIEWTYPKYVMATGYFDADAGGNYFWEEPPFSVEKIRDNISKLPKELYEVGDTAQKLANWTKEMDTTRPVIANCILPSASYESGYTDALDIVGFSYRQVVYDRCHKHYPDKPIMGTENVAQWHEWKQVLDKPYLSGIFLWTGIDYIGESGNEDLWPRKAMPSGLLDVAGFKKPSYYMFQALWTETPCIYMATQTLEHSLYNVSPDGEIVEKPGCEWQGRLWYWQNVNEHWNYQQEESVVVEVYSNCTEVSLFCNNQFMGKKQLSEFPDRIYKWVVPYQAGQLHAVGLLDGKEVICNLVTNSEPIGATLQADRTCISIEEDVAHIEVTLRDIEGNPVRDQDCEIEFYWTGDLKIRGIDNGDMNYVGSHQTNRIVTCKGKALLLVSGMTKGEIEIGVSCKGNQSQPLILVVE